MKMDLVLIGAAEEMLGYRLAGVTEVHDMNEENLGEKLFHRESLIFATHEAMEKLHPLLPEIEKTSLVFEIPQKDMPYTQVGDIIRDTIGFDLRR